MKVSREKILRNRLLASFSARPDCRKVAAAVSGGADSVAMLLLLNHYCRINRMDLCVFHVDHALRENSLQDCRWVESLATRLGLSFYSIRAQAEDFAVSDRSGQESWARNFRYRSFAKMLIAAGADLVATGHTANDQLETLLMRFFSGSSLQGSSAIRPGNCVEFAGKKLILWRPLLYIRRSDLEDYLIEAKESWIEDESNRSPRFLRNRVRHELMPTVEEIFPRAAKKSALLVEDICEAQQFIFEQANEYLEENLLDHSLITKETADLIKREVFRQWLLRLGFNREISRALLNRLVDLWKNRSANRAVDHRGFRFIRKRGKIQFFSESVSREDK